jgi:hypothetical protein|tara:strand:- start:2071 stop:2436 length:366 start_codon:yes stop_codon:yes gene_type:complete
VKNERTSAFEKKCFFRHFFARGDQIEHVKVVVMAEDTAAPTPAKSTAPDISGMYSLKVDNIAYRVDVGRVREMFAAHGEIGDVYMPRDRTTGNSRGFAFVRFIDKNEAEVSNDASEVVLVT